MKTATAKNTRLQLVSAPSIKQPKNAKVVGAVVDQVKQAFQPKNRTATCLGFLLGGFVPLASFMVAHHEVNHTVSLYAQLSAYLVLGGLLYSAKTVYDWGKLAFRMPIKAIGFVVLLEGIMVYSHIGWLSIASLFYLVGINGIATGCNLSLKETV